MKWRKEKTSPANTSASDTNGDLFGFDDVERQNSTAKTQKSTTSTPLKVIKKENKQTTTSQEKSENLKELSESAKDFKRNNFNEIDKEQADLNFLENADIEVIETVVGTKKGLSNNQGRITQDQIEVLKKCEEESTAAELRKISKRSNKTKFKKGVLDPLIDFGFFELTIPDSPRSPNQKYRLTGKFVRRIQKN